MKNLPFNILGIIFISIQMACTAQSNNELVKIEDSKLNYILGSLRNNETKSYSLNGYSLTIYTYSNISGSANIEGTDEVTDNLIFTICESGELFNCISYEVKNLYGVIIEDVKYENKLVLIDFSTADIKGEIKERKRTRIKFSPPKQE